MRPCLKIKHVSVRDVLASKPCPAAAQVKLRHMVDALFEHAHAHGVALKLELKIPVSKKAQP